ncbi:MULTISPECIES: class I SAM-dependent methyltransferase [Brevibacillus]|jgi:Dimethyladenosine transferase (rRNA methylation)|uniref:class I SAM-dependent methyltransferase n=1 Tax=Brevibacillus TaxID=55080 RepID=UPI000EE048A9|nr:MULTISPECIES: class I SAM-dependent methyltransferase [Brevibacillus]MDR4998085.1 class I SAM-dependent methyltransferase [Brevibacillus parabrevis]MED2258119.1 class I SAM-dependent methyltransferase [Brevibacillus parabrevis]HBZ83161.1 SAM-dependent methyltransferase [Brevibacillus sp.]
MYYGVRLGMKSREAWMEGMKNWEGKLPERMTDDQLEESFWDQFLQRKTAEAEPDDYVREIGRELLSFIQEDDEVLEIGPGWGNYTFAAASKARSLTCVDSSASVLGYLEQGARAKGLSNMSFVHAKWEEYEPPVHDVVFGVNCYYRMQAIDQAMVNMNNSARRLAVIGMTSGPEKPHYWDIHQQLGYKIRFSRRDYIHLTNLLYELGIDVNCNILPLQKTYVYESEEQFVSQNLSAIMEPSYDREKAEAILRQYLVWVDGKPAYVHQFKAALLYWKPERRISL